MSVLKFSSFLKSELSFSVCRTLFSRNKFTKPPKKPISYATKIPGHRKKLLFGEETSYAPKIPRHHKKPLFGEETSYAPKIPRHHKKPLFQEETVVLPPKVPAIPKQKFDYFLVLDIEATCDSPTNVDPQEIVEFPVVKVNAETFMPEATFHSYVRPTVIPELSDFCTALTGIIQEMIDQQPDFNAVFQNFLAWLEKEQVLKPGVKFAFVTCSDPDLEYFFPMQCQISGIEVPDFMKRWINVKRSFCDIPPYTYPTNLTTMMKCCDITPEGELHSGIDDALNLVKVLRDLAERGLVLDFNGSLE